MVRFQPSCPVTWLIMSTGHLCWVLSISPTCFKDISMAPVLQKHDKKVNDWQTDKCPSPEARRDGSKRQCRSEVFPWSIFSLEQAFQTLYSGLRAIKLREYLDWLWHNYHLETWRPGRSYNNSLLCNLSFPIHFLSSSGEFFCSACSLVWDMFFFESLCGTVPLIKPAFSEIGCFIKM